MQTAVGRKAEIGDERFMCHQNEPPCTFILGLTPKGTEGKNLMEVEEAGLWVVFRKDVLEPILCKLTKHVE